MRLEPLDRVSDLVRRDKRELACSLSVSLCLFCVCLRLCMCILETVCHSGCIRDQKRMQKKISGQQKTNMIMQN